MGHGDQPFPWLPICIVAWFVLMFAFAAGLGLWCM